MLSNLLFDFINKEKVNIFDLKKDVSNLVLHTQHQLSSSLSEVVNDVEVKQFLLFNKTNSLRGRLLGMLKISEIDQVQILSPECDLIANSYLQKRLKFSIKSK